MRKIEVIKILMFMIKMDLTWVRVQNTNLLIQAVAMHNEIKDMFRILGVPEIELEGYAEDYVNRIYLQRINKIIIYFPIFFLISLILSNTGTTLFSGVTQRGTLFIPKDCMFLWDEPVILTPKINHDRTVITDLKNPNRLLLDKNQYMISISLTTFTFPFNFQIRHNKFVIHFYSETNSNQPPTIINTKHPSKQITKIFKKSIFIRQLQKQQQKQN